MFFRYLSLGFAKQFMLLMLLFCSTVLVAQNRIVTENQNPGTPQSAWDPVADGGNIEGFAEEFTVEPGNTVHFKVDINSTNPVPYTIKIYRIGWYQGNGARFIADLGNSLTGARQEEANYDPVTGMTDCNNWPTSASWVVPANAVPGVYIGRMDCPSVSGSAILIFVVKDPSATLNCDLLFKTSDATWQAYNPYGGNSLYVSATPVPGHAQATKVSYQRVLHLRTGNSRDKSNFFNSEYPMIRWLERNGYDVSYTTDQDFSKDPTPLTPANCRTFLSVGHDEYWSLEARDKVEAARASGVNLAFFSGNEVYWKTRWEDNYQTLVCYKEGSMGESVCNTKCDPLTNVWTGLWRDGCAPGYSANDGCRPEGSLTGQMSWTQSIGSIMVPDTYKNLRFWKNTAVESLSPGGTLTLPYGTLGNEWDDEKFTETYPAHRTVLSNTTQTNHVHKMSLYRYPGGGLVFGAGTMQWAWGLDAHHDINDAVLPAQPESADMQQATVNLLFDMNAVPATLQANLVMPTALNDELAPTTVITSPVQDANVAGGAVTVTGTSSDNGGAALGGVEVSTDGGATWHVASGYENWTYTFSPSGYGTINLQARAWDEFGNVETVSSLPSLNSIAVNLTGPFNYSVFNETYPQEVPYFQNDHSPVELGMKFQSSIPGFITGLKYYKGADITGTHIGHLWDADGNMLAEETFTNETSSGWQTVSLSTPVPIQSNTTYTVSYFTTEGNFEKTDPFFTQSIQNGYLTGLASGVDGGNGVYYYGDSPGFPTESSGTSNYWTDVIMTPSDQIAPTVLSTSPVNNATEVNLNVSVTATFSEAVDPSTLSGLTAYITGPGNTTVPATLTVNGADVSITPDAPFDIVTTYTVTLKGGLTPPQIKDISGNALAADYTWSFTTGGLTPPQITGNPEDASTCANAPVSFTSTATGIPTPDIIWQVSTDGGTNWTDIPSANTGTYNFIAQSSDDGNMYHAVWVNSEGTVISDNATLTVAATITATIQAVNHNICPGDPLQIQLTEATGVAPFSLTINSQIYQNIEVGQIIQPVLSSETIFSPSDFPSENIHVDPGPLELGVRFKATSDGVIKGIRFYKGGVENGGTHIGNLWTTSGTLLGTATFTGETNSGWQEVYFTNPVPVTANTTYIASYFLPEGNYSKSGGYFDGVDHSNGQHLVAPQSADGEANGLYVYSSTSAFPTEDAYSTNYWVDVIYAPYVTASSTFNLTYIEAQNGCSLSGSPVSSTSINVSTTVSAGTVSGSSPLCIAGATLYSVTGGDAGGTWSSSNEAVATVNPSTGLVSALGAGTTDITYSVTGCSGTATNFQTLTVNPNANAGTVSGVSPLCIGNSETYTSDGDAGGTWSSTNETVATVNNSTGEVTPLSAGNTNIVYTLNIGCNIPATSFQELVVQNLSGNAGTVSGAATVCAGATSIYTSDGDAGGAWSSSDEAVATIDAATGELTAVAAGSATITYTVSSGCGAPVTATINVTVGSAANAGTVSGAATVCAGATSIYTSDGDAGGAWSSSDETVATIDAATGELTAVAAGSTTITYTVSSGCGAPVTATINVTVGSAANAGTVSGSATLCAGATSIYTSDGDAGGAWSSSDEAVATIDAATGELTAVAAGSATITYTVSSGCGAPETATINVTVGSAANAGTVSGSATLCAGATSIYTSDGDAGGAWSSSDEAVATIDAATGELTAVAAGSATITYTVSSGCGAPVTATINVTVGSAANAGTVSGSGALCVGNTGVYTSNGTTGGTWSSSDEAVATINATTGELTAVASGTTDIVYSVTGCSGIETATLTLTVTNLSGALAGTTGGGQECRTLTINNGGTTFTDASCNLIATVTASGLSPVSGMVNSCVTIDAAVQFFQGNPYVQRHYDIEPVTDPSGSTATIKLYFTQGEFDAYNLVRGIQPALPTGPGDDAGIANLLVTQYHGNGTTPGNYSGDAILINPDDVNIVWNVTTNLWEVSFDVVGFSGFYVYTSITNTPLPITLLSFEGRNNGHVNVLSWKTSSEQNSHHFELERSLDGSHFTKVATIAAAGNSATTIQYRKDDDISGLNNHVFYYRLKMVDINGSARYSNIVIIKTDHKSIQVTATPNPFKDVLKVNINSDKQGKVDLSVTDVSGRVMLQKHAILSGGNNVILLSDFINMSDGVYILHVTTATGTQSVRVVKQ